MDNRKIYLLAELTVLPEFLDEVKAALAEALIPTLQEPGCEALFETSREDNPHKLVFLRSFLLQRHTSSTLSRATRNERFQLLRASWLNRQS
jgi:quinol monooxygenase YgiN